MEHYEDYNDGTTLTKKQAEGKKYDSRAQRPVQC